MVMKERVTQCNSVNIVFLTDEFFIGFVTTIELYGAETYYITRRYTTKHLEE